MAYDCRPNFMHAAGISEQRLYLLHACRMWAVVRLKDVVVEFILDRAAQGDANPEERPMDNLLLPLSALATWAACAVRPNPTCGT